MWNTVFAVVIASALVSVLAGWLITPRKDRIL